jgi:hypothetical protein
MLGKFHFQGYHAKCNPFSMLAKWVCTLKFFLHMVKDPFHSQAFTPFIFTRAYKSEALKGDVLPYTYTLSLAL